MNSNELLHILQQDAFTKTVFTDVLPSDRLPAKIRKPKGFILNTDPSNKPGTHGWLCFWLPVEKKSFGIPMAKHLHFTARPLLDF
jgi:hypothetical protein